jgi:hypothetical protein
MAYVYRHIRLDKNEPFYIGIGSDYNYKRANSTKDRNIFWKNIANKTNYEVEIILDDLTWEDACQKEIEFINLYGRKNIKKGCLCNLTDGGEGAKGVIYSDERKESISNRLKGEKNHFFGKKHSLENIEKLKKLAQNRSPEVNKKIALANSKKTISEETKIRISNSTKGEKNHFYGKNHTKEAKEKISEKATGRIVSDEVKQKISKKLSGENHPCFGKKLSNETRLKISEKALGRKLNEEIKLKLSVNSPNRIEVYRFIDNKFSIFTSLRKASTSLQMSHHTLKRNLKKYGFITKEEAISLGLLPL